MSFSLGEGSCKLSNFHKDIQALKHSMDLIQNLKMSNSLAS